MKQYLFFIFFLFFSLFGQAKWIRPNFLGSRALGMGNTFLTSSQNKDALFYNPATLSEIKEAHLSILDLNFGFDTPSYSRITNKILNGEGNFIDLTALQQSSGSLSFNLILPYLGISAYSRYQAFLNLEAMEPLITGDSEVTDNVDIFFAQDIGLLVGFSIPILKLLSLGLSFDYIQRKAVDYYGSALDFVNNYLNTTIQEIAQNPYEILTQQMSYGYTVSTTAGAFFKLPLKTIKNMEFRSALVLQNIGSPTFKSKDSYSSPTRLKQNLRVGIGWVYFIPPLQRLSLAIEGNHLFDSQIRPEKTLQLGVEYSLARLSARLGFYQGYLTYGFSWELLPHTKIHFASYASETTSQFQGKPSRQYLAQLIIGFNAI